ncbi:ribonuclease H2, subunit B [Absidia repens]|uniref:Ribonuclease H2 subunit B n=1 Tax=Absidia repens TaxID=90262 RepID=A0A1X2I9E1_9FUNG|nr:ribonuclease H2, subunit B [Absidia repens]
MTSKKQMIAFTRKQDQDVTSLQPISLPCPRTGKVITFLYDQDTTTIFELSKVAEGRKACWLIDNSVYKDGALHFITPIDPLFIVLPILAEIGRKVSLIVRKKDSELSLTRISLSHAQEEGKALYRTMDDIFTLEQDIPSHDIQRMIDTTAFSEQLAHLCDTQEIAPGMSVYRYNEEKSLGWLKQKVDALVQQFDMIPQFKNSLSDLAEDKKKDHRLRESIYVLAKYLTNDWIKALFKCYDGLTEEAVDETEESMANDINNPSVDDYFQLVSNKSTSPATEKATKKPKPTTPRSLANVNTKDIKPLTSFFKSK